MKVTHTRATSVFAATLAALALGAAPALAGEDDDGDSEDVPAQIAPDTSSAGPAEVSGAPQGGVATGAGGMASHGPDALLAGLATGAIMLIAGGGGMLTAARRQAS
jgi:hypothetical protein